MRRLIAVLVGAAWLALALLDAATDEFAETEPYATDDQDDVDDTPSREVA